MAPLQTLRKLIEQQEYELLLESCETYWREQPDPAILGIHSFACTMLGKNEQALEYLDQARAHQPELDADALTDLVAALIVVEQVDTAIEILDSILAANPRHSLALGRRAYCFFTQNKLAQAEEYFDRSAQLEPTKIAVLDHLAGIIMTRQGYEEAQSVIQQGLEQLAAQRTGMPDALYCGYWRSLTGMQFKLWVATEQFPTAQGWFAAQLHTLTEDDFVHALAQYRGYLTEAGLTSQADDILQEHQSHYPNSLPGTSPGTP
jgi:tetratricopeptide (TPR) repeat protein